MFRRLLLPLLLPLAVLTGCASTPELPEGVTAPEALALLEAELAEAEVAAQDAAYAVQLALALRATPGLTPEERTAAEAALERAVELRIAELSAVEDGADELLELVDESLPRVLDARVAVAAAELLLAEGRRLDCYETLRDLDQRDAGHPMRTRSGELLAATGFSFAEDDGHYFLGLFAYRDLAPRVLEHLVVHYPGHPDCPRAYVWLAESYERDREWDNAIQRFEELVVYHPDSELATEAALRVAELRMDRLQRDDYDRGGLLRARDELLAWLRRNPDHPESERAREALALCRTRLASNDLTVARFYEEVEKPFGARLHAERALVEAEASGDEEILREVNELLAELPPPELLDAGPEIGS